MVELTDKTRKLRDLKVAIEAREEEIGDLRDRLNEAEGTLRMLEQDAQRAARAIVDAALAGLTDDE